MLITVLTPTYNRGYIIRKLYDSLKNQSNKNFEWIVIDDGSRDDTKEIFEEILVEKKIKVKYIEKINGGKHTAINKGLEYIKGEIVIIVDSDDYLSVNAIERIINESEKIIHKEDYAGICFRKIGITSQKIIGSINQKEQYVDTNSIEYRYVKKIKGDLAECFKVDILKRYTFPIYLNEKFVPEALVWNRIALKYKMRFFNNEGIYFCDYLSDGYSRQFNTLRKENPEAYKTYYREELKIKQVSLKRKIECAIRYIQLKILKVIK